MNVLLDNLDLYASAFVGTIQLFLVAAVGSLVARADPGGDAGQPGADPASFGAGYVNIVRNTPLTLVFFFFAFAYPRLEIVDLSFFARACTALIVYTAAFVCEVVRSGHQHGAGRAGRGVPGAGLHLRPDPGRGGPAPGGALGGARR